MVQLVAKRFGPVGSETVGSPVFDPCEHLAQGSNLALNVHNQHKTQKTQNVVNILCFSMTKTIQN